MIRKGEKSKKQKMVGKTSIIVSIGGISLCVVLIIGTLHFEFGFSGILLFCLSLIVVIPLIFNIILVKQLAKIQPVSIWENGIELPSTKLREIEKGIRDFYCYRDIKEIRKGDSWRDHYLRTSDGKKRYFRTFCENITIEDIVEQWGSKRE